MDSDATPPRDERADGWAEGYAEGLLGGLAGSGPSTLAVELLALCTCGVTTGGARSPRATCEVHRGK